MPRVPSWGCYNAQKDPPNGYDNDRHGHTFFCLDGSIAVWGELRHPQRLPYESDSLSTNRELQTRFQMLPNKPLQHPCSHMTCLAMTG